MQKESSVHHHHQQQQQPAVAMERRFCASHQPPSFRRLSFSSSTSSLSPFAPSDQNLPRQPSPDRITPSQPPPQLSAQPSSSPSSSSAFVPETAPMQPHPWHLQGPRPISPLPESPQISAAELLTLTQASATQNGTYQCSLCAKQFGYKNGLIRHVRLTHVGEKPYQCSICNRRFGYKHILLEHQNLHFGNRPYVCAVCDKRFAARSNLIQHQMVHKRPFNCTLCSRRFDREEQLKKHLFVHPDVCRFGTDSCQVPVARRQQYAIFPADGTEEHLAEEVLRGGHPQRRIETTMAPPLPDSSQEHLPAATCSVEDPMAGLQSMADGHHGNRIDAVCGQRSLQRMATTAGGVTIKQELVDSTEEERSERQDEDRGHHYRKQLSLPSEAFDLHRSSKLSSSSFSACPSSSSSAYSFRDSFGRPLRGSSDTPVALTSYGSMTVPGAVSGSEQGRAWDKQTMSSSALPGIHEVLSRRAKAQELPSFANFMPLPMGSNRLPLPDLALKMRHHHHNHHHHQPMTSNPTYTPSSLSVGSSSSVVEQATPGSGGQRPTAQLPPITNTARQTKDQAIQHSLSIAGFPSLDDVLSYYISQGRLFKCQHCNILFFERGMYFLHASLHGLTSPWECSICHKVCSDKNEFTLHFVNQQHNP